MTLVSRLAIAAGLTVTLSGVAPAQTSGVLNTIDVQRLVAADTPSAHLALSKHYIALTETYAADAARFRALATTPTGNPNHPVTLTGNARRAHQADVAASLAAAAHAMVSYHELLAIGSPAKVPASRAAFDGGRGARIATATEVAAAVASARTRADHRALEEYFSLVAAHALADAGRHTAMARAFRASAQRGDVAAMHCDRLAARARAAAQQATSSARLQHQLVNVG